MKQIFQSLFQTQFENPFGNEVQTCAYLLKRKNGNFLIYSSSHIESAFSGIKKLGGVEKQFLNHRDEASEHCNKVFYQFGAPLICHELEREAIESGLDWSNFTRKAKLGEVFSKRTQFAPDFEAIPTPGHCPGSTCYLWNMGDKKFLFTGDTFYPRNGEWCVAISNGLQDTMIRSLEILLDNPFDVIVPGLFIGAVSFLEVTAQLRHELIKKAIDRLKKGDTH